MRYYNKKSQHEYEQIVRDILQNDSSLEKTNSVGAEMTRIEFSGELIEQNKKIVAKYVWKERIAFCWAGALWAIPAIWLILFRMYVLGAIVCIVALLLTLNKALPQPKKLRDKNMPHKVTIDCDEIVIVGAKYMEEIKFHYIKQIDDNGDHYLFRFGDRKKSPCCLCQKNLITKGTIEEFEEKFADKIVRVRQ